MDSTDTPYELADDETRLHRYEGGTSRLAVGVGYGVGQPNWFVWLDENDGERLWWLDADQAERLGNLLIDMSARCRGAS